MKKTTGYDSAKTGNNYLEGQLESRRNWVQLNHLGLIEGIWYQNYQTEIKFVTVSQNLVPWERVSNVVKCC